MYVMIDDRRVARELAQLPVFEFSGGIAATVRIFRGAPWQFAKTLEKLATALRSPIGGFFAALPSARIEINSAKIIRDNQCYDGFARLLIFSGEGEIAPHILLSTSPFTDLHKNFREHGATATTTTVRQFHESADYPWATCSHAISAANLAKNAGANFGIVGDENQNYLTAAFNRPEFASAETAGIFAVVDNALIATPQNEQQSFNPDPSREIVLQLAARHGIVVYQEPLRSETLANAAEIFVAAAGEIIPLKKWDTRQFIDFPVSRQLQTALVELVARECSR